MSTFALWERGLPAAVLVTLGTVGTLFGGVSPVAWAQFAYPAAFLPITITGVLLLWSDDWLDAFERD